MKKIKLISVILALVLMISCFAACGGKPENPTDASSDASTEANEATDEVTEEGTEAVEGAVLTMGTNAAFPPYEFVADDGSFAGIDVEIASAVAEKLGMTLEVKDMEFDSLISAVEGGVVDVVLAGLTVNEERMEKVNFSTSYAKGVQVIIVKEGSEITDVEGLAGKIIGVQAGTTGDIYCTGDYGQENVKQFANGGLAVQALLNDQVDCVVIDNEPAKAFVAANEGLVILDTEYTNEDYAAAFAKENTELLDNFNAALAELTEAGTISEIIEKYIPAE